MEKTFVKGLTLLQALAKSAEPRGVTELAKELKMTKSNVHRLLNTLVHVGFVERNASTGTYNCTLKLWEVAAPIIAGLEVKTIAVSFLRDLAARTQETVHLSVLDNFSVLYIDKIDSPQPVRAYSEIAGRAPAHCVATGKALLAFNDEVLSRLTSANLDQYTQNTITDFSLFKEEVEKIRKYGYAVNKGEWRASVGGIAAPIFDSSRTACAAIGISAPIERLPLTQMQELAPRITEVAKEISTQLGGNWEKAVYSTTMTPRMVAN